MSSVRCVRPLAPAMPGLEPGRRLPHPRAVSVRAITPATAPHGGRFSVRVAPPGQRLDRVQRAGSRPRHARRRRRTRRGSAGTGRPARPSASSGCRRCRKPRSDAHRRAPPRHRADVVGGDARQAEEVEAREPQGARAHRCRPGRSRDDVGGRRPRPRSFPPDSPPPWPPAACRPRAGRPPSPPQAQAELERLVTSPAGPA